jgi:secretory lipase
VKANIDGGPFFAFLAGTAIGFRAAYPGLNLNQYLTLYGRIAIGVLDGLCQLVALALYAFRSDRVHGRWDRSDDRPGVAARINETNLGTIRPSVPVYQYQGLVDEVISDAQEETLHKQWCALGARSQLVGYAGDHVLTQLLAQADVVNWIANRFAGAAAPSNC